MNKEQFAALLLKIGLASTFIYASVSSFVNPSSWIGYLPQFLTNIIPATILLAFFSAYEILLSIWILSGVKSFYSALLAAATLAAIILLNLGAIEIIFRDFGLFLAALALAELARDLGED